MKKDVWFMAMPTRKNNVWFGLAVIMLLVSFLLAACGNSSSTSTSKGEQNTGTPTTSARTVTPTSTGNPAPAATTRSATQKPTVALTSIRMLDQTHGWALTESAVLKTSDGGIHWNDVSPAGSPLNASDKADFMDAGHAWIAVLAQQQSSPGTIKILRTVDGGEHWQLATIPDTQAVRIDRPHFVNTREGWIEVGTGAATSHESVDIFHSADGGQTWLKIASAGPQTNSGLSFEGDKTGISFKDTMTGWATASTPATDLAWLYVTHDGGKTWHSQSLPKLAGMSNVDYNTTPPVFFGNNGILPVQVGTASGQGLDLYVTHDGGNTWIPTTLANVDMGIVYVLDMQHAWATDGTTIYATSDGGQSWIKLAGGFTNISEMSFADATNGWAIASQSDKTPLLLHTTDGGKTWRQINYSIQ
jgi:photosystem II stability/assembly factor-like uncharacterized protein